MAIEVGCQLLDRVEPIRESAIGRPVAAHLERGESTARRLRAAWVSDDPNLKAMVNAGWIDRGRWRDLPAQRTAETPHLLAFYGNSFTRQIANQIGGLEPAIAVRMIFGPVAPASHAYACFLEDRGEHAADAVVIGVVLEMLPGLRAMTRATQSVVEPFPYTFPRYWIEDGALASAEPAIRRFDDFGRALEDAVAWEAHLATLEGHDDFYSAALYNESWLDELALSRLLKSAWTIRRQRSVEDPVLAGLADPGSSEPVAVLVEILRRFGEQTREDGRRPLVLLIDTPAVSPKASRYVRDQLAARSLTTILTADSCDGTDPRSYAADGHLSEPCALRVAERVRDWIEAP